MRPLKFLALPLVAAALAVAGCGGSGGDHAAAGSGSSSGSKPLQKITFTLNFLAGGPQAGFMYAKQLGYYKQAGLDVDIKEGQGSATTAKLIGNGNVKLGFTDAPAAMQVRSQGGKDTVVAPVLQSNAFSIMSLAKTGIRSVQDLVGKNVAVQPGTAQTTLLDAIFKANGVDKNSVRISNIDPSALVGSLLQGKVDAILGGADFQGVQLTSRGADLNQLYYRDLGVPTVGLSIVANDDYLKSNGDTVRKFVQASLKGWQAAAKDPAAAAAAVADQFPTGANKDEFEKQLKVDLGFTCVDGAQALGNVPKANWKRTYSLLTKYIGLPDTNPVTSYYTEDYLPSPPVPCP